MRVAALRTNTGWDLSPIIDWLSDFEIAAILSSRFRSISSTDKWIWCIGKWHNYFVKEGYKVAHNVILLKQNKPSTSSSSNSLRPLWKTIWKLKVPYKILFFMWKIFSNALPTFDNLFKRNCSKTNLCMICKSGAESFNHLFGLCYWVRKLWFVSPFTFRLPLNSNFNLNQWLLACLTVQKLDEWDKSLLCTIL